MATYAFGAQFVLPNGASDVHETSTVGVGKNELCGYVPTASTVTPQGPVVSRVPWVTVPERFEKFSRVNLKS